MTFLAPTMLWSLLALAPLVAVYFLKVRPRRKLTTAYFLWDRIFQENRAASLFQRLRDLFSLLLMLMAAGAICLALAQPVWTEDRQDLLVVLDVSASMDARDSQGSRLEAAKELASDMIEGLNGAQRAAVATLASQLAYCSHLTDSPRELLDAIEKVEALPEEIGDLALAELAGAGDQWQRDRRVLLISDGGFDAGRLGSGVELLKVGEPADNVGLVAVDMAFLPDGTDRLGVFFQVASTCADAKTCDLSLFHLSDDGSEQLMKVIPLELSPGVNGPERFVIDAAPSGRWAARLDASDALKMDDTAYVIARKPPPVRVSVESDDRFFLENSVLAFAEGQEYFTLVDDAPEVAIAKGVEPPDDLAVIFHPVGASPWWSDLGEPVEAAAPRVLAADHLILRHLDAATIPFDGARRLAAPAGSQVLVADETGLPLLYLVRREGRSAVIVNLDPIAGNFYFSAWFPVLVHSAVTHLVGREMPLSASFRPQETIPAVGARVGESVALVGPHAGSVASSTSAPRVQALGATLRLPSRLGFYDLQSSEGRTPLAASLLSSEESLLDHSVVGQVAQDSRRPIQTSNSPVRWLTVLALVVLTGESLLYHRRKVG